MKLLKSQWPCILFGICAFVLAIINLIQGDNLMAVAWTLSFVVWFVIANINYNEERITALEKEVEELKNRAITDMGMSRVDYNHERIEALEFKAKKYDALAEEVKAMRELQQTYEKLYEQRFKNLEG